MNRADVLAHLVQWIQSTYSTGIAWTDTHEDTVDIDWTDDSSTQITIAVRNLDPATKRWADA